MCGSKNTSEPKHSDGFAFFPSHVYGDNKRHIAHGRIQSDAGREKMFERKMRRIEANLHIFFLPNCQTMCMSIHTHRHRGKYRSSRTFCMGQMEGKQTDGANALGEKGKAMASNQWNILLNYALHI